MHEGHATEDGEVWRYPFDRLEWMRGSLSKDGSYCVTAFRFVMSHVVDKDQTSWVKTVIIVADHGVSIQSVGFERPSTTYLW